MSQHQRELMKAWFADHPDYYRRWTKGFQQWRDEQKALGVNVRGNSRPLIKGKLAYEISPTVKLSPEERYVKPEEPVHRSTKSRRHSNKYNANGAGPSDSE